MANIKIRVKEIMTVLLLLCCSHAYAQKDSLMLDELFANLITTENKIADMKEINNAAYILITDRMCENCFKDVCNYLGKEYPQIKDHIYAINFTKKGLLKMLQLHSRFSESVPCAKDIYFYWTDQPRSDSVSSIFLSPSPQFILVRNGVREYFPYKEVSKIIR